jgi:hypothetical protein
VQSRPPSWELWAIRSSPGETIMVKHGALSKSHVYQLLRSKDARIRRAAFTLLEMSNPRLRRNSELFVEITRFIAGGNTCAPRSARRDLRPCTHKSRLFGNRWLSQTRRSARDVQAIFCRRRHSSPRDCYLPSTLASLMARAARNGLQSPLQNPPSPIFNSPRQAASSDR